jgi:hypothetical protein
MSQNQNNKLQTATATAAKKKDKTANDLKKAEKPILQYRRSKDDGTSDSEDQGSSCDNNSSFSSSPSSPASKKSSPKKYKTEHFDKAEYAKLLAELFPSKYATTKASLLSNEYKQSNENKKNKNPSPPKTRRSARLNSKPADLEELPKPPNNQNKRRKYIHDEEEEDQEVVTKTKEKEEPKGNYNIVINLQEPFENLSDEYDDDSALDDSVYDDESISSDQEDSSGSDETYRESGEDESDDESDDEGEDDDTYNMNEKLNKEKLDSKSDFASAVDNISFTLNGKSVYNSSKEKESKDKNEEKYKKEEKDKKEEKEKEEEFGTEDEATIQTIKAQMEAILAKDKNNKIARTTLDQMIEREEKIKRSRKEKSVKKMRSNTRKFGRLLQQKNSANDLKYFKKYLSSEKQVEVLTELSELNKLMLVDKPYRLTLLESKIPQQYKAIALKRIQNLRYMDTCSGEYFKVKNWVDTFMTIPFGVHRALPITMDVGVEQCNAFMESAKDILDSAVYGLNDAKMQIMQMVGQWISNPNALGSAIAIKGPPGTGKTTLVKEGISKILGRDFAFIALGGATDSSFMEGHSYTYEGSTWGKIVDILIRCKSMNPVIFFDELDKLSNTPKGEEITGILTHLTDTSQNSQFHDKYFSEIPFDLSKCLFIFSYNDESKVNPILLDRMYRIHTNGYAKKDKTHIAQKYLIPKIQSEVAFKPDQIIIPDETIEYMVEHHTDKEDGVRNLKRCLEIIFTKLNLYRLMKPGSKLFDKDSSSIDVTFPFTVTSSVVDIMIKKAETNSPPMFMYT